MSSGVDVDLGSPQRQFTYDKGGVGAFLMRLVATPLVVLILIAGVVLPVTVGRGHPLRGAASDAFEAALTLLLVAHFGYFFWSVYQVSGYRTAVFTVFERGLVRSRAQDEALDLPAAAGLATILWAEVVEVVEWRHTSLLARWLLPPNRRYRAAIAVRDGWALVVTGATKDATVLVAIVRARMR